MTKKEIRKFIEPYRVTHGSRFKLDEFDPGDTGGLEKQGSRELLEQGIELLSGLQEKLYAQDRFALLLVFQAMDAAGKDSTIRHVMSGVNPQGVQVYSFKVPSAEELDHDFLWRCVKCLPERGRIGIFNRSYYEEVLVVRVHPEILEHQRLPPTLVDDGIWDRRYEDIAGFERYLARNGTVVRKFFLHVSEEEQRKRFLERLEQPEKNWKFSIADAKERERFDDYMRAYEEAIRRTASEEAPWFVVPADHKWFTRLVVAAAVIDTLHDLDLHFPRIEGAKAEELEAVREALEGEHERDVKKREKSKG